MRLIDLREESLDVAEVVAALDHDAGGGLNLFIGTVRDHDKGREVTHLDYSARIQTVHEDTNPRYYALLKAFEAKTGHAVLVNTSFNVRGEPIVSTPEDAYRCFMRTEMDVLVLENCILLKSEQKPLEGDSDWKKEFELD